MQRYEAHLEGIGEENAEIMCASAPNDFKDLHFDHPTSCVNWVSSMATVFIITDGFFFCRESTASSEYGLSRIPVADSCNVNLPMHSHKYVQTRNDG